MNEMQIVKKLERLETRLHRSDKQMVRGEICGSSVYVAYPEQGDVLRYGYRVLGSDRPLDREELIAYVARFSY